MSESQRKVAETIGVHVAKRHIFLCCDQTTPKCCDKARSLGLPLSEVTSALSVFLGSQYVNDFDFNNRAYRVFVQADQRFRASPANLKQLYARASNGDMIPLDTVVRLRETTAPQVISHFNLFRSAEVTGNPAPGRH